jgi:hypothetical protein
MGQIWSLSWWRGCQDRFPADCYMQNQFKLVGAGSFAPEFSLFVAFLLVIFFVIPFIFSLFRFISRIKLNRRVEAVTRRADLDLSNYPLRTIFRYASDLVANTDDSGFGLSLNSSVDRPVSATELFEQHAVANSLNYNYSELR